MDTNMEMNMNPQIDLENVDPDEIKDRSLAYVARVDRVDEIPGADAIEVLSVRGWKCVAKKGEFEVGSLCVYIESGSVLPELECFEFMREKKFRLKTVRLRGQVSQGLAMPLKILPNYIYYGYDVTALLGVKKYIPKAAGEKNGNGMPKGNFPDFIRKTDEPNIQNCGWVLAAFQDDKWVAHEKLDGSSMTIFLRNGVFGVCSRNLEIKPDEPGRFTDIVKQDNLEEKIRRLGLLDVAVQGELCGPGIQGNKYGLTRLQFFPFQIFDINFKEYFDHSDFVLACRRMKLEPVPCIWQGKLDGRGVKEVVEMAVIRSRLAKDKWAEGLVFRPEVEVVDYRGNRVSFKAKNPEFLIKYGE